MKRLYLCILIVLMLPAALMAQNLVSGRVVDEGGLSLPGATVKIGTLKKAAVTDESGSFKLVSVPQGKYDLTVSYIGYETQTHYHGEKSGYYRL